MDRKSFHTDRECRGRIQEIDTLDQGEMCPWELLRNESEGDGNPLPVCVTREDWRRGIAEPSGEGPLKGGALST